MTVDNDEGDITDSNREQVDAGGEEEGEESTLIEDERGEVRVCGREGSLPLLLTVPIGVSTVW